MKYKIGKINTFQEESGYRCSINSMYDKFNDFKALIHDDIVLCICEGLREEMIYELRKPLYWKFLHDNRFRILRTVEKF